MALIEMSLYDALERDIATAKETDEMYSIRLSTVKKDLMKRKAGRVARIVILSIWAVIIIAALLVASGVLSIGGGAQMVDPSLGETPDTSVESEPIITFEMLPMLFVPMTWTLCFVGFPIGWGWSKGDRNDAKHQIYVQHTINEDGTVDTYSSGLIPRISAFIMSVIMGCLTMAFSIPVAIVQCFTWGGQIKRIEGMVAEIEANPDLFEVE